MDAQLVGLLGNVSQLVPTSRRPSRPRLSPFLAQLVKLVSQLVVNSFPTSRHEFPNWSSIVSQLVVNRRRGHGPPPLLNREGCSRQSGESAPVRL